MEKIILTIGFVALIVGNVFAQNIEKSKVAYQMTGGVLMYRVSDGTTLISNDVQGIISKVELLENRDCWVWFESLNKELQLISFYHIKENYFTNDEGTLHFYLYKVLKEGIVDYAFVAVEQDGTRDFSILLLGVKYE